MIFARPSIHWFALPLAMIVLGTAAKISIAAPPNGSGAQASGDVVVSDSQAAADPFAVPNGSTQDLLDYIEKIAHPKKQFANQEEMRSYFGRASVSIGAAADKVLAAPGATDQQAIDAIEWKVESLRIKGELGDEN